MSCKIDSHLSMNVTIIFDILEASNTIGTRMMLWKSMTVSDIGIMDEFIKSSVLFE